MSDPEPYWDIGKVAVFLDQDKSWVYDNWRKLGIPAVRIGRGLRFKPSKVAAWAEAQTLA